MPSSLTTIDHLLRRNVLDELALGLRWVLAGRYHSPRHALWNTGGLEADGRRDPQTEYVCGGG